MTGSLRRRVTTAVACNACRESKRSVCFSSQSLASLPKCPLSAVTNLTEYCQCNGAKPSCSNCARRGRDCVYRAHRSVALAENIEKQSQPTAGNKTSEDYTQLVTLMRSLPEDQILALVRQIRSMRGISAAAAFLQNNVRSYPLGGSTGLSNTMLARAVSPPSHTSLEFELMCQHTLAYPQIHPPDRDKLAIVLGNDGIRKPTPSSAHLASSTQLSLDQSVPVWPPTPVSDVFLSEEDPVTSDTIHGPKYRDERLSHLNIGYWIKTPISNEVAATLLSFFLETDHESQGVFDADLFIEDLVNCRTRFCSSFLVISVLYLISASLPSTVLEPAC